MSRTLTAILFLSLQFGSFPIYGQEEASLHEAIFIYEACRSLSGFSKADAAPKISHETRSNEKRPWLSGDYLVVEDAEVKVIFQKQDGTYLLRRYTVLQRERHRKAQEDEAIRERSEEMLRILSLHRGLDLSLVHIHGFRTLYIRFLRKDEDLFVRSGYLKILLSNNDDLLLQEMDNQLWHGEVRPLETENISLDEAAEKAMQMADDYLRGKIPDGHARRVEVSQEWGPPETSIFLQPLMRPSQDGLTVTPDYKVVLAHAIHVELRWGPKEATAFDLVCIVIDSSTQRPVPTLCSRQMSRFITGKDTPD